MKIITIKSKDNQAFDTVPDDFKVGGGWEELPLEDAIDALIIGIHLVKAIEDLEATIARVEPSLTELQSDVQYYSAKCDRLESALEKCLLKGADMELVRVIVREALK